MVIIGVVLLITLISVVLGIITVITEYSAPDRSFSYALVYGIKVFFWAMAILLSVSSVVFLSALIIDVFLINH